MKINILLSGRMTLIVLVIASMSILSNVMAQDTSRTSANVYKTSKSGDGNKKLGEKSIRQCIVTKKSKLPKSDYGIIRTSLLDTNYTLNYVAQLPNGNIPFKTSCAPIPISKFMKSKFVETSEVYAGDERAFSCKAIGEGYIIKHNALSYGEHYEILKTQEEVIKINAGEVLVLIDKNKTSLHTFKLAKIVKVARVIELKNPIVHTICDSDCYRSVSYGEPAKCIKCNCSGQNVLNDGCNSNGYCNCKPGYKGYECEQKCNPGTYGDGCKYCQCNPNNYHSCDHITGKCMCKDGYLGSSCDNSENTTQSCNEEGECICKTGYTGRFCDHMEPCAEDEYRPENDGSFSECEKCDCDGPNVKNSECEFNGFCKCKSGYSGKKCEDLCPNRTYGDGCQLACGNDSYMPLTLDEPRECIKCNCNTQNALNEECNANGKCKCRPGYGGAKCEETCDFGHYGAGCKDCPCNEDNLKSCDFITGKCTCKDGYLGSSCNNNRNTTLSCDEEGECICKKGYTGIHCGELEKCDNNEYRPIDNGILLECKKCNCAEMGTKSCSNGKCICKKNYYGQKCGKKCKCQGSTTKSCDKNGKCICNDGYSGKTCKKQIYGIVDYN